MTARDRVIRALGCFCDGRRPDECPCEFRISPEHTCDWYVAKAAKEMLEAVEPITTKYNYGGQTQIVYRCGYCHDLAYKGHQFCPQCGRKIKWE